MSIEEKLEHFYETAVDDARKEAQELLSQHQQHLETELEEHKRRKQQEAEAAVKAEAEAARRKMNKALSIEHWKLKQYWNQEQSQLKEELFSKVLEHLNAFMDTPEYEEYLCEKIKEAKDFAGEDDVHITLSASDQALEEKLSQKTGIPLSVSETSFLGGIQATIPQKNILIDNSFQEKFLSLKKEFTFEGGEHHE